METPAPTVAVEVLPKSTDNPPESKKSKRGGFRPGSGRKPKSEVQKFIRSCLSKVGEEAEEARLDLLKLCPTATEALKKVLEDDKTKHLDRIKAAEVVFKFSINEPPSLMPKNPGNVTVNNLVLDRSGLADIRGRIATKAETPGTP